MSLANTHGHSSLEDRLDQPFAEAWRPAPGECLVGTITALDQRISSFDGVTLYPVVTLRRDDGTTAALHAFHAVAKAELSKLAPKVGERIGVKYLGKPEGKSYQHYRVVIDREASVDWDSLGREAEAEILSEQPPAETETAKSGDDIPF